VLKTPNQKQEDSYGQLSNKYVQVF